MAIRKIAGTWKVDDDILDTLEALHARSRVGKGDLVQLGIWIVDSLRPEDRDQLFLQMADRVKVTLSIVVNPDEAATPEAGDLEESDIGQDIVDAIDEADKKQKRRRRNAS
jgi:hypothetical protein